jgi:hypothetical protein
MEWCLQVDDGRLVKPFCPANRKVRSPTRKPWARHVARRAGRASPVPGLLLGALQGDASNPCRGEAPHRLPVTRLGGVVPPTGARALAAGADLHHHEASPCDGNFRINHLRHHRTPAHRGPLLTEFEPKVRGRAQERALVFHTIPPVSPLKALGARHGIDFCAARVGVDRGFHAVQWGTALWRVGPQWRASPAAEPAQHIETRHDAMCFVFLTHFRFICRRSMFSKAATPPRSWFENRFSN